MGRRAFVFALATLIAAFADAKPSEKAQAKGAALCMMVANNLYTPDDVRAVLAPRMHAFDACYAGLEFDVLTRGSQVWTLEIENDGRASKVTPSPVAMPFDACMSTAL